MAMPRLRRSSKWRAATSQPLRRTPFGPPCSNTASTTPVRWLNSTALSAPSHPSSGESKQPDDQQRGHRGDSRQKVPDEPRRQDTGGDAEIQQKGKEARFKKT